MGNDVLLEPSYTARGKRGNGSNMQLQNSVVNTREKTKSFPKRASNNNKYDATENASDNTSSHSNLPSATTIPKEKRNNHMKGLGENVFMREFKVPAWDSEAA